MRGLIQGWPKQFGTVWMTRAAALPSKAAPIEAAGGRFGATLSVRDRRIVEARVTLREVTDRRPSPTFARGVNVRYFPSLPPASMTSRRFTNSCSSNRATCSSRQSGRATRR